jgi:hypothetical protein
MAPEWRNPGGWLGHGGVLLYCAVAHLGGAFVMARWQHFGLPAAAAAVLAVAHARVWAAYLIHEAAHGSVFKAMAHNSAFGTLALWLCVPPGGAQACAARPPATGLHVVCWLHLTVGGREHPRGG